MLPPPDLPRLCAPPAAAVRTFPAAHLQPARALTACELRAEAGGVVELVVLRPADAAAVLADAMAGDARAYGIVVALRDVIALVEHAPRHERKTCVSCSMPLRREGFAVGLIMPTTKNPSHVLGLGCCRRCARSRSDVTDKLMKAVRAAWPDVRPVIATHTVGSRA